MKKMSLYYNTMKSSTLIFFFFFFAEWEREGLKGLNIIKLNKLTMAILLGWRLDLEA